MGRIVVLKKMEMTEHLKELRSRLLGIIATVSISFVICYALGDRISEILLAPLREVLASHASGEIVYLGVMDKVISQIQIAFWASLFFSSPLWFYQIWKFIKPGLYQYEIKAIRPFVLVGFILFSAGITFGHFLLFPFVLATLVEFGITDVKATISLKEYLTLSGKVLIFLGLIFQFPNCLLILGFMGLVTKQSLQKMRCYIYVLLAILSAIMTPPDPMTMLGLWVPMVALFEIGILAMALIVHPYLKRQHS